MIRRLGGLVREVALRGLHISSVSDGEVDKKGPYRLLTRPLFRCVSSSLVRYVFRKHGVEEAGPSGALMPWEKEFRATGEEVKV